ncbi:hypothetical protein BKI52_11280 [marine bacterium AO1-C]|nr:hypothetical protein BKI52_11280 [marine bacterium AO1-C]
MDHQENNSAAKPELSLDDRVIAQLGDLHVCQVGQSNLEKYTQFIYNVYVESFSKRSGWQPSQKDYEYMLEIDRLHFPYSHYFVFKDQEGNYVSGGKITRKVPKLQFNIETKFHYDLDQYFAEANIPVRNYWHIGRLATDKQALKNARTSVSSLQILNKLVEIFGTVVTKDKHNIVIAELDALAYRIFKTMGINVQRMGEGVESLGSLKYPVYVLAKDIRHWMHTQSLQK